MKIDIFPHILPPKYLEAVEKRTVHDVTNLLQENVKCYTTLQNLDQRFRIMDNYDGLVQVLTLSSPGVEAMAAPEEEAALVRKYPDRFVAGVATLPWNDVDASLREAERAIKDIGLRGVQVWSSVNGKPLDLPEFFPLYDLMTRHDLPIWIHPRRDFSQPDYPTESMSKYALAAMIGWAYETTLAMSRLVYSGVLEKYPTLKIITHHAGAMVPFLEQRLTKCNPHAPDPARTDDWNYNTAREHRGKRPWIDYFHMFYNDTAVYGNTPALMNAYAFFGAEHLLFGTDMPYVDNGEPMVRDTISSVERMDIPKTEKAKIFEGNAKRLLRLIA